MSYLVFDLLAVALPAALLLFRASGRRAMVIPIALLAGLALVWTAPWDRHLVRTQVWSYDPRQVLGQWLSIPYEEFGFVVLEVVLVAAWSLRTVSWTPSSAPPRRVNPHRVRGWLAVGALGLLLLAVGGQARYLGLLLAWVAPPFALQHAVAHDVLVFARQGRLLRALPVALWLCCCDRLALHLGIWTIGPASSTGLSLLGLPVEEALFFWLTCLLTADGLFLARHPVVLQRLRHLPSLVIARAVPVTETSAAPATR